jgi:hypothetical protein
MEKAPDPWLKVDPDFADLRDDPRFKAPFSRMNLQASN